MYETVSEVAMAPVSGDQERSSTEVRVPGGTQAEGSRRTEIEVSGILKRFEDALKRAEETPDKVMNLQKKLDLAEHDAKTAGIRADEATKRETRNRAEHAKLLQESDEKNKKLSKEHEKLQAEYKAMEKHAHNLYMENTSSMVANQTLNEIVQRLPIAEEELKKATTEKADLAQKLRQAEAALKKAREQAETDSEKAASAARLREHQLKLEASNIKDKLEAEKSGQEALKECAEKKIESLTRSKIHAEGEKTRVELAAKTNAERLELQHAQEKRQKNTALEDAKRANEALESERQRVIELEGDLGSRDAAVDDLQKKLEAERQQSRDRQTAFEKASADVTARDNKITRLRDELQKAATAADDATRDADDRVQAAETASRQSVKEVEDRLADVSRQHSASLQKHMDYPGLALPEVMLAVLSAVQSEAPWKPDCFAGLMRRLAECLGEAPAVYPAVMRLLVQACRERVETSSPESRRLAHQAQITAVCDVLSARWAELGDLAPSQVSPLAMLERAFVGGARPEPVGSEWSTAKASRGDETLCLVKSKSWDVALVWLMGTRKMWFIDVSCLDMAGIRVAVGAPTGVESFQLRLADKEVMMFVFAAHWRIRGMGGV